ncbi:MAG: sensor histidine kinase [Gemmataceae bacterium]
MQQRITTFRLISPFVLTSALLLILCGVSAGYLYHLQSVSAHELGENVVSRRAAFNLEDAVGAILIDPSNVPMKESSRAQILRLIDDVVQHADKQTERQHAAYIQRGFHEYSEAIKNLPARGDPGRDAAERAAAEILNREVLKSCQALRDFNATQIDLSEREIRQSLQYAAWGLGLVGTIGSIGGLLLGFGMARTLRQKIHRMQIQVRDAADKLGHDLPTVVVTSGDIGQLDEQVSGVTRQIEEVVKKLQQREHEILRAEQLAAVGQLAAGVAHEIRNPLTSIKLLVEMAREEAEAGHRSTDDLRIIEDEIRRMERSLNSFLAFARPPRPEKSPQQLAELIDQTLSLVQGRAARQRVFLDFHRPPRSIVVEADGGQLQQVLVNLALNSLEAMRDGGRLTIDLKTPVNGAVELQINDTGPGIAPEMRPRLFEPFASDKETGLGLGLVISKRILEDHGGSIHLAEHNGSGASFVVKLPAL